MARLFELYGSSWEMMNLPNDLHFSDFKLTFSSDRSSFSVNFNVVLKVLRANGFGSRRPSITLIESIIADCYRRHIASGGEIVGEGVSILNSGKMAAYRTAVAPRRSLMH